MAISTTRCSRSRRNEQKQRENGRKWLKGLMKEYFANLVYAEIAQCGLSKTQNGHAMFVELYT